MSTTTPPLRYRVHKLRGGLFKVSPPPLWIVELDPAPYDWERIPGTGRRDLTAPRGTVLAATWREAIDYALTGKQPRTIAEVYPEYCGLPNPWRHFRNNVNQHIAKYRGLATELAAHTATPWDRPDSELDDAMDWNGRMP